MAVVIGLFVGAALVVALGGSIVTNVKLWGLVGESRRSFGKLPPEKRRTALVRLAITYALVLGEFAIILAAPFGVRKTLVYFVILPVVVLGPFAIIAVGIRGFRGQRRRRPPST